MLTLVSNFAEFTRWLQAQPLRLLSSAPVGSSLSKGSAPLGLLTRRFCSLRPCPSARSNLATDSYTIWARAAQRSPLLLVPVSAYPPSPSLSPHSTLSRRPHKACRFVCSLGLERIDRSDQSAGLHLQISKFATYNLYKTALRPTL